MEKKVETVLEIIDLLDDVDGLFHAQIMTQAEKDKARALESTENIGVAKALSRKYTVCVFHDSSFRKPAGDISEEIDGKTVFPGVPFPEIKAKKVISSSPGKKVHRFLKKSLYSGITIQEDAASLLVGFDL